MSKYVGLQRSVGEFIVSRGPYDVFATFTIREENTGCRRAIKRFLRMCQALARGRGGHVLVAWCWGLQPSGRPHFHALFRSLDGNPVRPEELLVIPGWGLTEVEPCQGKGAAHYLAKRGHDWSINTACDRSRRCRRRSGCVEDVGPWPTPDAIDFQ